MGVPGKWRAAAVRNRFGKELLLRYLAAKAIEPEGDDFFREAVLLETEAAFKARASERDQP